MCSRRWQKTMEPLKDYIKARDLHKEGKRDEALRLMASSMGVDQPTPIMEASLDSLLDCNDAVLTIILNRLGRDNA
jgi:hypothetical protein